jgi:ribosomal-protein-alanine N-acetyltransferase
MPISIRPLCREDSFWLTHFIEACFATPQRWTPQFIQMILSHDMASAFLVSEGEESAGCIIGRIAADEAEIITIAVLPQYRRQGIAKKLMHHFENDLRSRGVLTVHLEVSISNNVAEQLYLTHGYTKTGMRPGYYREGGALVDAVTMAKTL